MRGTQAILPAVAAAIEQARRDRAVSPLLVAIDGRCGSGKTTLAATLQEQFGYPVVHMDHFFLRPEQRTAERLQTPGGNIDHERFLAEVLRPLRETGSCVYRPYNCQTGQPDADRHIPAAPVCIIEGSYSCHPALWDRYDLRLFLSVGKEEQLRRITARSGEAAAEVFRERWIPLEETYFTAFRIAERCDLRLATY